MNKSAQNLSVMKLIVVKIVLVSALGCGHEPLKPGLHGHACQDMLTGTSSVSLEGDEYEFQWSFKNETFELTGKSIPPELLTTFTGHTKKVGVIKGHWTMLHEIIEFTDLTVDESGEGVKTCKLRCFNSGQPTIICGENHYRFSKSQPEM